MRKPSERLCIGFCFLFGLVFGFCLVEVVVVETFFQHGCSSMPKLVVAPKPLVVELKTNSTLKFPAINHSIQKGSKNRVDSPRQRPGRHPVCTIPAHSCLIYYSGGFGCLLAGFYVQIQFMQDSVAFRSYLRCHF